MESKGAGTVEEMVSKYWEYKEVMGDMHTRVVHPDIGQDEVSIEVLYEYGF